MFADMDWFYRPGHGEARVSIHDGDAESGGGPIAVLDWSGDVHLIPHAPAAYFDKIVCNLRNDRETASDLLERVTDFIDGMVPQDWDTLLASDSEWLRIPGKGGADIPAACLRGEAATPPFAEVKAKIVATESVLGATTHFKPKLRGQNPTIAELGFWAMWDWMTAFLLGSGEYDGLAHAVNNMRHQAELYETYGIPGFREMGSIPLMVAQARSPHGDEPSGSVP
jgi:hypothetical protein